MDNVFSLPEIQDINNSSNLPAELRRYITKEYEDTLLQYARKTQDNSYHFFCRNCVVFTDVDNGQSYVAEIHMIQPCRYHLFTINGNTTFEEAEEILEKHSFVFDQWRGDYGIFVRGRVVVNLAFDPEYGKNTKIVISCI